MSELAKYEEASVKTSYNQLYVYIISYFIILIRSYSLDILEAYIDIVIS